MRSRALFLPALFSSALLSLTLCETGARAQEDQPPITPPALPTVPPPPPAGVLPSSRPAAPSRAATKPDPSSSTTELDRDDVEAKETEPDAARGRHGRGSSSEPVVRAQAGNLGMFFRFGGLATLFTTGNTYTVAGTTSSSGSTDALVFTQAGIKIVKSETWMIPIYLGTGLRFVSPSSGSSRTDWGLDIGSGFEYHFRIWRRLSPFIGLDLGLGFSDPTGDSNLSVGVGLGPSMGVELYIMDRVSLAALYKLVFQITYQETSTSTGMGTSSGSSTGVSFQTEAGGALLLNYYF
jgi:hypothetical protein